MRVRTAGRPEIEWAIVEEPFVDPFFEQTVDRAMQLPFNQVFARRTPLDVLDRVAHVGPAATPAGFVFHMSRCGSTLVAQILAAHSATFVLSEPQPIDALLAMRNAPGFDEETLVQRLRGMIAALVGSRDELRTFVKFHAWHVLELPLITRAFPSVPWVFLFREPRAVLRSQARTAGAEASPGTIDPGYLGLDFAAGGRMPGVEFAARFLAALCEAASRGAGTGRAAFVDYADLPNVAFTSLPAFFGLAMTLPETQRMRDASREDTKNPGRTFHRSENASADESVDRLAAEWLDGPYARLRALAAASPVS